MSHLTPAHQPLKRTKRLNLSDPASAKLLLVPMPMAKGASRSNHDTHTHVTAAPKESTHRAHALSLACATRDSLLLTVIAVTVIAHKSVLDEVSYL